MKSPIATSVVAGAAVLALAGCSYVNPITTQEVYAPSDGRMLELGDVEAFNLIVVSEGEGEPATLIGSLYNDADEDITVQVTFDGETVTEVIAPAGDTVQMGPDGEATEVSGTALVQPGLLVETVFVSEAEGTFAIDVPVMDGTLPEYASVVDAIG